MYFIEDVKNPEINPSGNLTSVALVWVRVEQVFMGSSAATYSALLLSLQLSFGLLNTSLRNSCCCQLKEPNQSIKQANKVPQLSSSGYLILKMLSSEDIHLCEIVFPVSQMRLAFFFLLFFFNIWQWLWFYVLKIFESLKWKLVLLQKKFHEPQQFQNEEKETCMLCGILQEEI